MGESIVSNLEVLSIQVEIREVTTGSKVREQSVPEV